MIWFVCVVRVFIWQIDNYIGIIDTYNTWPGILLGIILLTFGLVLTMIGHFNLASLWRSGIDPKGAKSLRITGLYKYSRNPMYVGVAMSQVGFLFALPSVFSFICLIVGLVSLYRQVILEEMHLSEHLPTEYKDYKQRVPRWL